MTWFGAAAWHGHCPHDPVSVVVCVVPAGDTLSQLENQLLGKHVLAGAC